MFYIARLTRTFIVICLLSLVSSLTLASDFYGPLDEPCHPQKVITCSLPYPSDIYAYEEGDSETGLRLDFPIGIVREELLEDVPPSLTPQTVFNGSNGFSAATSVLFELDQAPDLSTIPESGGDTVVAYNLDTGERVPLRVQLNEYARSKRVAAPSQIMEIYPRSRWDFGNRYVVALTHSLKTAEGERYQPSSGYLESAAADGSRLSNYYESAFEFLALKGHSRDNLSAMTFFTVRSENEVTGPLKELTGYVYEEEHPIRNLDIRYPWFGWIGARITGDVYVHDFRNDDGGMEFDVTKAQGHWIRFRLTLPRAAKRQQVPIAIYGHGLTALKETDLLVSLTNASLGIATVSIDHPNHGTRIAEDGGYVMSRLHTEYVPMQVGMMTQSSVDFMSLLKAVKTSISTIDVLPKRMWSLFGASASSHGDGIPEIDTSRIFYQGTSLGGVLGSTFVSLAPDLKGAFLHVTGVGITNILSNSQLWDSAFSKLEPAAATGAEAMILKSAMQHEIDYGDAINFVHYFREPPITSTAKPVAISAGLDDQVVPNLSTIAMAEIAQLPLVGTERFAIPGVEKQDDFIDGYGVMQVNPLFNIKGSLRGLMAHTSFLRPEVNAAMKRWIKQVVLEE